VTREKKEQCKISQVAGFNYTSLYCVVYVYIGIVVVIRIAV